MPEVTFDQKLKAFDIATRMVKISEPKDETQEAFNREMDDYLSTCGGIALLILQTVGKITV
ncbi:hypothetical protein AGMMS49944_09520 [Spirochaetia bacterium]|nr:hypothetical protein AGMMS49944_09520 [Spirochaetia bacterium]